MKIQDAVYSDFRITSPIALALIKTNAFQRLKGISQFGVPDRYYHVTGYSRYDHSLGVYILLNRLGASEEEQVAGLLHDISHTAFSHLVDWVIGDSSKEDYQDNRHLSILQGNEIAEILRSYGFTPEGMANYHAFGLLERDAPNLCADRIDYALREFEADIVQQCLSDLSTHRGEIVFLSEKSAESFATRFLYSQLNHWAGYEAITRYVLLADLLQQAMAQHTITLEDFSETDEFVIDKITNAQKKEYTEVLNLLENTDLSFLRKSDVGTKKKFRYVDPKILLNGELVRLSAINEEFREKVEDAKRTNEKGTYAGVFD